MDRTYLKENLEKCLLPEKYVLLIEIIQKLQIKIPKLRSEIENQWRLTAMIDRCMRSRSRFIINILEIKYGTPRVNQFGSKSIHPRYLPAKSYLTWAGKFSFTRLIVQTWHRPTFIYSCLSATSCSTICSLMLMRLISGS